MKPQLRYRSLLWTAVVAGVYSLVVCTLLLLDAGRRLAKPPLDEPQFLSLKQRILERPEDEATRTALRTLDFQLRQQYFRQQQFTETGVYLLLGGIGVTVLAARRAAVLHRRLPRPMLPAPGHDPDERLRRLGLAAVGLLVLGLAVAAGVLAAVTPTALPAGPPTHDGPISTADSESQ
jgi:hypothetical protein